MQSETRQQAEAALKEIEALSTTPLPPPAPNHAIAVLADAENAPDANQEEITRIQSEIDLSDTASIVRFGSMQQSELNVISQKMLDGVKNKDVGPAGDALRDIVSTIRGFSISQGDASTERSWWAKLTGKATPFAQFLSRYESIQSQVDVISDNLLKHEHALLKDIKYLDLLYEKTLAFYHELGVHILAGELLIKELDEVRIPALDAAASAATGDDAVIEAQKLRDLRSARDDLERRIHDLKLTRQVTMQALPSMRLVQENDKSLVVKINSTLVNTVPLWETQLAQAITIQRSADAAASVRAANDLTNELLTANAANLRQANAQVRKEVERGIFDIEAVKAANADLIATIEESLQIADEGKAKRAEAERELVQLESELKGALAKARA